MFPDVDHWPLGPLVNNNEQSYILHTDGKEVLWGLWTDEKNPYRWRNLFSQSKISLESSPKWMSDQEQKIISVHFCKTGNTRIYYSTEQGWHSGESAHCPLILQIGGLQKRLEANVDEVEGGFNHYCQEESCFRKTFQFAFSRKSSDFPWENKKKKNTSQK